MKYIVFTISSFFVGLFLPAVSFAQTASEKYGQKAVADSSGLSQYSGDPSVIAGNVIGAALSLVGVIFFVLMVYAGFMWMTDRGNEENAKKALHTLTAAIIGLIVVLASYAVTQFVFGSNLF